MIHQVNKSYLKIIIDSQLVLNVKQIISKNQASKFGYNEQKENYKDSLSNLYYLKNLNFSLNEKEKKNLLNPTIQNYLQILFDDIDKSVLSYDQTILFDFIRMSFGFQNKESDDNSDKNINKKNKMKSVFSTVIWVCLTLLVLFVVLCGCYGFYISEDFDVMKDHWGNLKKYLIMKNQYTLFLICSIFYILMT